MFAAAEIPPVNSSRSRRSRVTGTTSSSGSRNNRFAMGKSRCGAVRMPDSINGRPRKNFRRIWPRSFRPQLRIRPTIIRASTTLDSFTTCNGLPTPAVGPASKISSAIQNSGGRNFSTLTKNISLSARSTRSSATPRKTFSELSGIRWRTRTTTGWCPRRSSSKEYCCRF